MEDRWKIETLETVRELWEDPNNSIHDIAESAGLTPNNLECMRRYGPLRDLPNRKPGGAGGANIKTDDESAGILFGLPKEEWLGRKDAVRESWDDEEKARRRGHIE